MELHSSSLNWLRTCLLMFTTYGMVPSATEWWGWDRACVTHHLWKDSPSGPSLCQPLLWSNDLRLLSEHNLELSREAAWMGKLEEMARKSLGLSVHKKSKLVRLFGLSHFLELLSQYPGTLRLSWSALSMSFPLQETVILMKWDFLKSGDEET